MKKLIVIIPVILLISLSVYIGITYFNIGKYDEYYINNTIPVMKEEYIEQITSLKEKYNNKDVVGTISIDNTDFNTVVMQGNDNSYYLNHLPDKTYNINGSIFLDYRVDIDESNKLLIFGHSSPSYFLPIMIIENYKDEDYYNYSPMDVDLNFNSKKRDDVVVDNQRKSSNYGNYQLDDKGDVTFKSETIDDFSRSGSHSKALKGNFAKSNNSRPNHHFDNKPGKNKRHSSKKGKKAKAVLAVILVLILIIVGSVFPVLARVNYDEKKEDKYVTASDLKNDSSVKNILLLGVDARNGENAEQTRSDTMMIVSVDSKHHSIKLVSFLRDTWVYIPSLGHEQRLNAACSDGGYKNVVETIEYNFGIDVEGYVVTDFEMFKVLVDSLGGVKIDVTEKEAKEVTNHPKRYGDVTLESGNNKLTGEQALAYCRIRKIDTDFVRTQRQRTVMSAILKKALTNPFKLYKMAYNSAPYIETDLSKGELMGLVSKAGTCVFNIHQTSVPFDGTWDYANIWGNSVIKINTEKNKDKLIDYIYNLSSADIKAQEKSDE